VTPGDGMLLLMNQDEYSVDVNRCERLKLHLE